jgi:DNA-binding transcriptional LysR family regulator
MPRYDDLATFVAVVRAKSFTRAAAQLGVSQSALSQSVKALERRLDLKLLNRTTRSVAATEAGQRLFETAESRFAEIDQELAILSELRSKPAGTVRINASEHAMRSVIWPRLDPWRFSYPDIVLEMIIDNRFIDIVAERYDIGVRLGEDVAKDMIAVRISPDIRMAVVGSPDYFARYGRPEAPKDLTSHNCICLRLPTYGGVMPWEFHRRRRKMSVHVHGNLIFSGTPLVVSAAEAGHGLAWVLEEMAREQMTDGRLETVMTDWAVTYPGYHLYYPSRRTSPAMRLVIDALRVPH